MQNAVTSLDGNIYQIDTGYHRPGLAACYVMIEGGRAAIFDTGVEHSVTTILAALDKEGLSGEDVEYIVPTHVHLDHAGGAGRLMQECKNARMIIHPRGARQMIDPAKLIAGAEAVYGREALLRSVGEIVPVDAERVIAADDGYRFRLTDRELVIVDTPGHARHHFCIWDEGTRGFFSGDTFGVVYPELCSGDEGFIFPPTTPVQFDPEAWHASIDQLMAWRPECMYLTHFGRLDTPLYYVQDLHRRIHDLADTAMACKRDASSLATSVGAYMDLELDRHGCQLDETGRKRIMELDMGLIVQGLEVWLSRQVS